MQMYWDTQSRWKPPLIDPQCTEPYYTRTVLPIAECRCTKIPEQMVPPIESNVQSPTTPGQMPIEACTACWDTQMMTPLIGPTCTEPYYTRTVWPITECIGNTSQMNPPPWLINQLYRALLHQDSMILQNAGA